MGLTISSRESIAKRSKSTDPHPIRFQAMIASATRKNSAFVALLFVSHLLPATVQGEMHRRKLTLEKGDFDADADPEPDVDESIDHDAMEYEGSVKNLPIEVFDALDEHTQTEYDIHWHGYNYHLLADSVTHEVTDDDINIFSGFQLDGEDGSHHTVACNQDFSECNVYKVDDGNGFSFEVLDDEDEDDRHLENFKDKMDPSRARRRLCKKTHHRCYSDGDCCSGKCGRPRRCSSCWYNKCQKKCFSSETTVQVLNQGKTKMSELKVGDFIMTPSGEYEKVYGWADRKRNERTQFLKIETKNPKSSIELTPIHLLYTKGSSTPIAAANIKIGDILEGVSNSMGGDNNGGSVTSIKTIHRVGAYAPLTKSATLLVNGVAASSLSTMDPEYHSNLRIGGISTPFSYHTLAQIWFTPYRLLCLNTKMCEDDNEVDGIASSFVDWTVSKLQIVEMVTSSNLLVQLPSVVVFGSVALVFFAIEMLLSGFWMMVMCIVVFALLATLSGDSPSTRSTTCLKKRKVV